MEKTVLLLWGLVMSFTLGFSQGIFVPNEFQKAIEKGTRTLSGTPGENYWQNSSNYKIDAEIDIENLKLIGSETITYFNNSPDTLKRFVIRLYNDIQSKGASRDYFWGREGFLDPTKIKQMKIGEINYDVSDTSNQFRRGSTNLTVLLEQPILPKSENQIIIDWEMQIPSIKKIRMGDYGNGDMFISYWYPQISVYDDIYGWDMIDYQGVVEFYNDINNFNVNMKLPKNYVMWSTGVLQNGNDVLASNIYEKYEKAKTAEEVVHIITKGDRENGNVTANKDFLTWNMKAENVPDFSFAISKNFLWDGRSVVVDKKTSRTTFVQATYGSGAIHWDKGVEVSAQSIKYMSEVMPGFSFPYPEMTSIANPSGGGGMETPMMANDGSPKDYSSFVGLVFHEISHTYFPFSMGTSERRFAWMDEGWATFFPREKVEDVQKENSKKYWEGMVASFESESGSSMDIPLMTPSFSVKGGFPRMNFYRRPAMAYMELRHLFGVALFKKAMFEYMSTWVGKHPIPTDFFSSFEKSYGEDLSWFWNPWFYQFGRADLGIDKVKIEKNIVLVSVKQVGKLPTRILLKLTYKNGEIQEKEFSAREWKDKNIAIFEFKTLGELEKVELGNSEIPDMNRENNIIKM